MKWDVNTMIHDDYTSVVSRFEKNRQSKSALTVLYGYPGSGKTRACLEYCKRNPSSLYFGFRGFTADMALRIFTVKYPSVFASPCDTWEDFFNALYEYAKRRTPVIFFDDAGERNDKPEFYTGIKWLCERFIEERIGLVALTQEPWDKTQAVCLDGTIPRISPPEITRFLPEWTVEDVFRLFSLADGNYALISEAEGASSFTDYLERVCNDPHSAFMTLAPGWLDRVFRSPESYHSLLYGIACGRHYISELSEFTGYPKNKCEKYLGALIDAHLIAEDKPEGHRPRYLFQWTYISVWYQFVFASMGSTEGMSERIAEYVEESLLPTVLHWEVMKWVHEKAYHKLHSASFTPDPKCENIRINGVTFDYFGNTSDETIVAVAKVHFDDADWEKIERAIESRVMFYDAKIVLCSIHQFSRFYWRLNKKHDNIRLVQLKSMG